MLTDQQKANGGLIDPNAPDNEPEIKMAHDGDSIACSDCGRMVKGNRTILYRGPKDADSRFLCTNCYNAISRR